MTATDVLGHLAGKGGKTPITSNAWRFPPRHLRYLKLIRSVRLSVEALFFKASLAAFALC
jgi:hypothetical protein